VGQLRSRRWIAIVVPTLAVASVGCTVPEGTDGNGGGGGGGGLEIQYCEEDSRGGLQNDRCTQDPDRYGDGRYEGSPFGGGDGRSGGR
jgi:hypothetical protein